MFWETVKYILPALAVLIATYLLIRYFFKEEEKKRAFALRQLTAKDTITIRLRAYERIMLFLSRTIPETLILRTFTAEMTNMEVQSALIDAVRHEFEHNLSQQIYVSNQAWELVVVARESIVRLVNSMSVNVDPMSDGLELCTLILNGYAGSQKSPSQIAIDFLKDEVRTIY